MGPVVGADTKVDNGRFAHRLRIVEDIIHGIGNIGIGEFFLRHSTEHKVGLRSHALKSVPVTAGCSRGVGAVRCIVIVGC